MISSGKLPIVPLILDPRDWTDDRLRALHRELADDARDSTNTFSAPPPATPNPFALEQAATLLGRSAALADELLRRADPAPGALVAAINPLH